MKHPIRAAILCLLLCLLAVGCASDSADAPEEQDTNAADADTGGEDDPCAGIANSCEAEGRTCDGATLLSCLPDANGCLIRAQVPCDGGCVEAEGDARCEAADPCEGLSNTCLEAARRCEGDELVVCAADLNGCLIESRASCADIGETCDPATEPPACTGGDACDPVSTGACEAEGPSCASDTQLRLCNVGSQGCFYEQIIDCPDNGTCGPDPALGVRCTIPCEPPAWCDAEGASRCDGSAIETCADVDGDGCPEVFSTDCGVGACDESSGQPVCDTPGVLIIGTSDFRQAFSSSNFTPLENGATVPIYQGAQGRWMYIITARTRGLFTEPVDISLRLDLEGEYFTSLSYEDDNLTDGGDGYHYYPMINLDFGLYAPLEAGRETTLTVTMSDVLGNEYTVVHDLLIGEAVPF